MTQDASGNIWTPTIIFSNSPLSDQTLLDQQVPISNLQTILDLKAVLTVAKRTGPIPALPEEAVEVLNIEIAISPHHLFYPLKGGLLQRSKKSSHIHKDLQEYFCLRLQPQKIPV